MTKAQLLKALQSEVSPQELAEIKAGTMPHISSFNAKLICDLMEAGSDSDTEIADAVPQRLREVTNTYLAQYLAEYPEAWKWIYLSCAYTAFLLEIPMHPREWVHFTEREVNGKTMYFCPAKSREPETNCSFCVCRYPGEAAE